jgi:DnaJ-class molecular chaperone
MATSAPDPYRTLGVSPAVSDDELRTAYRRLVQLHHPDHNNGSHESALRFAEVQEAYAHVKLMRKRSGADQGAGAGRGSATGSGGTGTAAGAGAASGGDPEFEARLAAMERELRTAREQREHAAREAARAAQRATRRVRKPGMNGTEDDRASDEELGYISTDDSFSKILDDFADQVSARFSEVHPPPGDTAPPARPQRAGQDEPRRPRSVADWIDELGTRLTGERRPKDEG